jgi:lipoprotein-anchoring transpeptidase ErfK/SrfK
VPVPARRLALGLGAAALMVSACAPAATVEFQTVVPSDQSRATISAQPSGQKKVDPGQQVTIIAKDGQLEDVVVTGPKGPLKGAISADGTTWTAKRDNLAFGTTYTVKATAVDQRGVPTTHSDAFRTLEPKAFFGGTVSPRAGATVGVGMPISVTFDRGITDKKAVEEALVVYTPEPIEGAWSWASDSVVQFRPKKYWPANIDVTVDMNFKGVKAAKRIYGDKDTSTTFSIGPRMVTQVDAATHTAKVFRDGEKLRTMPITTGKSGFETRSGIKVIVSKERTRLMDAATGGTDPSDPEYYSIEVEYAMRVTYSGEFLHAAPWSVGSQGFANVSHGCVGMSTANAQWLYDLSNIGDVVEVTGTSNQQNLGNGITVWNEDWDQWLEGSKTGSVMTLAAPQPTDPSAQTPGTVPEVPGTVPSIPGTVPEAPLPGTGATQSPEPGTNVTQAGYGR